MIISPHGEEPAQRASRTMRPDCGLILRGEDAAPQDEGLAVTCVMPLDDSDRPPVLAHQRFVAAGDRSRPGPAQRFQRIHATNLWGAAHLGVGAGFGAIERRPRWRRTAAAAARAQGDIAARRALRRRGWIARVDLGVRLCRHRHRARPDRGSAAPAPRAARSRADYQVADITRDACRAADAVLCRDCLVHLSFANIHARSTTSAAPGARWLITTTFPSCKPTTIAKTATGVR